MRTFWDFAKTEVEDVRSNSAANFNTNYSSLQTLYTQSLNWDINIGRDIAGEFGSWFSTIDSSSPSGSEDAMQRLEEFTILIRDNGDVAPTEAEKIIVSAVKKLG